MAWKVPKMWEGGTAYVIGGGPSTPRLFGVPERIIKDVTDEKVMPSVFSKYYEPIHGRHVIGVNNAYKLGPWVDLLFFGDCSWFLTHRANLKKWPGIKTTCCHRFETPRKKDGYYKGVKYLAKDSQYKQGLSPDPHKVAWNGNSGAGAINLAVHLGAANIVLFGFDMKLDKNGVSHWHGAHYEKYRSSKKGKTRRLPFKRHLRGFPKIAEDAKVMGVQIYNASPDSDIDCFEKTTLTDALAL